MTLIKVSPLNSLRNALFPLVQVSNRADMKCTPNELALTVSHRSNQFTAALRMSSLFFASYETEGMDGHFLSRIYLDFFFRDISNICDDDLSLTIIIRPDQTILPLKYEIPRTGYLQYSALILLPPQYDHVGKMDIRTSVAIKSEDFRRVAREYVSHGDTIRVTLYESRVKFTIPNKEIVLTSQADQCTCFGVAHGSRAIFRISLHPVDFFLLGSHLTDYVWIFKSFDTCTMMSFPIGGTATLLVYYPRGR